MPRFNPLNPRLAVCELSREDDTSLTTGTPAAVAFDTQSWTMATGWHSTSSNPSRFINPLNSSYSGPFGGTLGGSGYEALCDFDFSFRVTNPSDPRAGTCSVLLVKNGTDTLRQWDFPRVEDQAPSTTDADDWVHSVHATGVLLEPDDYCEVYVAQSTGATQTLHGTDTTAFSSILRVHVVQVLRVGDD